MSSERKRNRTAYNILTSKPTGNRILGRHRYRWKGNIRLDLKEIPVSVRNWMESVQDLDCEASLRLRLSLVMELLHYIYLYVFSFRRIYMILNQLK